MIQHWSNEIRYELYKLIIGKYGPHIKWGAKFYPSKDKKTEYEADLQKFSIDHGFSDGGAQSQVNWSITIQKNIKSSQINLFLENKKCAFKCGFITAEEVV